MLVGLFGMGVLVVERTVTQGGSACQCVCLGISLRWQGIWRRWLKHTCCYKKLRSNALFKRTVQTHWGRGRQPSFSRFCLAAWAFQPQGKLGYLTQVVETHRLPQKAAFKRTEPCLRE